MRSPSVSVCALVCALVVGLSGLARAEDLPVVDHGARDHVFVTILALKLRPDVQRIKAGDAVGWLAVSGHTMPRWEALQPRIRSAWAEAVRGALGLPPGVAPGSLAPPPAPERA